MLRPALPALLALSLAACAAGPRLPDPPQGPAGAAGINLELGIRYLQQGSYGVAETKLEKALSMAPDSAPVHNALGVLLEQTGRPTEALGHFRQAVDLDGDFTVARLNLGRLLCQSGQPAAGSAALALLERRYTLDRPEQLALEQGRCRQAQGQAEAAEAFYRQALEMRQEWPPARASKAGLMLEQGQPLRTRAFLQRLHAVTTPSPASLWLGVRSEQTLGNPRLREQYAVQLRTAFPESPETARLLGESER